MSPVPKFPAAAAGMVLAILCCAAVPAQTNLFIPDPNPLVPGGTSVNTIPFGSAAYTYMGRIPASLLDPVNTQIEDIAFSPGATNTWTAAAVLIGIGHVPNPLPCPFSFPGPGGTPFGSFNDFTVIYDSSVHLPLSWNWTAATFSFMGLDTLGSNTFQWNGVDDIGVYITFTGATATSGFHRNNTAVPLSFPTRTYVSGYQMPMTTSATACDSNFGLVMGLKVAPGANLFSISQSGPGVGDLNVTLDMVSPTALEGWTLVSANTSLNAGTGPVLGIVPDATTWSIFSIPYFPGNPFHFRADDIGVYPDTPFTVPPGTMTALTGQTLDFVTLLMNNTLQYDGRSNVVRVTFQ